MSGGPPPAVAEDGAAKVVRRGRRATAPEPRTTPLVLLGLAGVAVLALGYLVAVRVGLGQGMDDWLFEARKAIRLGFRRNAVGGPMALVVPIVAAFGVGAVVAAVRRYGVVSGVVIAVAMAATTACSTVLKATLPRPELHDTIWAGNDNSYPSGHLAGVLAVVLAWVLVVSARRRPVSVLAGSVVAAWVTVVVACSGWHRPSDLAGGVGLALAWACLAAVVVVRRERRRPSVGDVLVFVPGAGVRWLATTAVLELVTVVGLVAVRRPTNLPLRSFVGFSVVVLVLVAVVTAAIALFDAALTRSAPDTAL